MQVKRQGVGFPAAPSLPPPQSGPSEEAFSCNTVGTAPFSFYFPMKQSLRRTGQPHPAIYFIPTVCQCAPQPWRTDPFLPNHYRPRSQCGSKVSSGVCPPVPLCSLLVAHELPELLSLPLILLCGSWDYRHIQSHPTLHGFLRIQTEVPCLHTSPLPSGC